MGMVTVLPPVLVPATKSPLAPMLRLTVRLADGAGAAVTVKLALAPSVTAAPAVTLMTGPVPSSSAMVKAAEPEPLAPPPKLVPEFASSVPSAMLMVSSLSAAASELASTRTDADAELDAPPVKVMLGEAVLRPA